MIIVKSIKEKPKECRGCRFLDEVTYDCAINPESIEYTTLEGQYEQCPIEELPDINVRNMDAISRQQAIDAVAKWLFEVFGIKESDGTATVFKRLRELPSAEPEPKSGKWIRDRSGSYCCNKCMEPCATYVMMKPRDKFCKMCGSRNEVME